MMANDFYSHASCEARHGSLLLLFRCRKFLLTRLLRGATTRKKITSTRQGISTHTPLARRDKLAWAEYMRLDISTHTPLARRDNVNRPALQKMMHFYSHASCEARPLLDILEKQVDEISTHTPLARRDSAGSMS